jgi:type IV pilus assembly protein PilA
MAACACSTSPHRRVGGFSLMELVVAMSVMAILATIAIPSVRDRIVRQQVAEALPLADFAQKAVGAYYAAHARLPVDNAEAGLPPADRIVSKYIAALAVEDGALVLTFSDRVSGLLSGKTVSMRPATVDGYPAVPISWMCGHADLPKGMTVQAKDKTTVEANYLPVTCRSRGGS